MDNNKKLYDYVRPNWVITLILMLIPVIGFFVLIIFLTQTLPALFRANKYIKKLESSGKAEQAANEFISGNCKELMKGKLILTENFVFSKSMGYIFTYDEILWAYKHRFTKSILLIPIKITDSLYLATKNTSPKRIASMGKDKKNEIQAALLEIYAHNNNCLIGYNNENIAKYKVMK